MLMTTLFEFFALTILLTITTPFVQAQGVVNSEPKEKRNLRDLTSCRANIPECDYDCNKDCDCEYGLVCYHREEGTGKYFTWGGRRDKAIPGCHYAKPDNFHNDYCINPHNFPAKTLWYIGSDGKQDYVYPLKECWGDCDSDDDCAHGLKCFHRDGNYPHEVPGCSGDPVKDIDYCYRPHNHAKPAPRPVSKPVPRPAPRPVHKPHRIPDDNKYLIYWGNDGDWPSYVYPFGRCQGDCDKDSDCKRGYKCVGANSHGEIPGCFGHVEKYMNYCV